MWPRERVVQVTDGSLAKLLKQIQLQVDKSEELQAHSLKQTRSNLKCSGMTTIADDAQHWQLAQ